MQLCNYANKCCGITEQIIDYLSYEISQFIYFIICGAQIVCKVINTQHWRFPLVQGGLEIPIRVTINMNSIDISNKQALARCRYWVACIQKASQRTFEDATYKILQMLKDSNEFSEKLENQAGRQASRQGGRKAVSQISFLWMKLNSK